MHLSWGHDEYVYHVFKNHLPEGGALRAPVPLVLPVAQGRRVHAPDERERPRALKWVKAFNRFDLYSKGDARPDVQELTPYYKDLIDEFVPGKLRW